MICFINTGIFYNVYNDYPEQAALCGVVRRLMKDMELHHYQNDR